ncbi:MAG: hypothetical protein ACLPUO_26155 [Streptosporangiaceae bacterium]
MSTSSGAPQWWMRLSSPDTGQPEAGQPKVAGQQTVLLTFMTYFWGGSLGGVCQILFGGYFLGSKQAGDFNLSNGWLQLVYVLVGLLMIEIALGILRLEAWVYWASWLFEVVLTAILIVEIVRWATGAPITLEVGVFACLDILFVVLNLMFLLQHGIRQTLRYPVFRGEPYSPPLVVFVVVLTLPALAIHVLGNYVDNHLTSPVLALVYVLTFALMILMAYGALGRQAWTWFMAWAWAAVLTALSVDVIVRRVNGSGGSVQGLITSIVCIVFVASVVYYLLLRDVQRDFIHARPKNPLFSPPILLGGLLLAVFALVAYLLPGELGTPAIAYTVLGLAIGAIVGLLPDADPIARLMGFALGLLLAFASYVVRGGFLPYTKWWSAAVVLVLLAIITGITALFRSSTWFVSMLLGAGTLYGVVELQFQAAPSAYLASLGLAFLSILFSFGIGYMISAVLGLKLVPAAATNAAPSGGALATQAAGPAGGTAAGASRTDTATEAAGKHAQGAQQGGPDTGAAGTRHSAQEKDAEGTDRGAQGTET